MTLEKEEKVKEKNSEGRKRLVHKTFLSGL